MTYQSFPPLVKTEDSEIIAEVRKAIKDAQTVDELEEVNALHYCNILSSLSLSDEYEERMKDLKRVPAKVNRERFPVSDGWEGGLTEQAI